MAPPKRSALSTGIVSIVMAVSVCTIVSNRVAGYAKIDPVGPCVFWNVDPPQRRDGSIFERHPFAPHEATRCGSDFPISSDSLVTEHRFAYRRYSVHASKTMIAVPTVALGDRATLDIESLIADYVVRVTGADYAIGRANQNGATCFAIAQSIELRFDRDLTLARIPSLRLHNVARRSSRWSYALVDLSARRTPIATATASAVRTTFGGSIISFRSLESNWHVRANHAYVFSFREATAPEIPCGLYQSPTVRRDRIRV